MFTIWGAGGRFSNRERGLFYHVDLFSGGTVTVREISTWTQPDPCSSFQEIWRGCLQSAFLSFQSCVTSSTSVLQHALFIKHILEIWIMVHQQPEQPEHVAKPEFPSHFSNIYNISIDFRYSQNCFTSCSQGHLLRRSPSIELPQFRRHMRAALRIRQAALEVASRHGESKGTLQSLPGNSQIFSDKKQGKISLCQQFREVPRLI